MFKKIYQSEKLPIYCLLFLYACISIFITILGDDLYFSTVPKSIGIIPYLINRYATWTSRIVIEGIMVLFASYLPLWIWKIVNIGMYYVICVSLSELLEIHSQKWNILLTFLIGSIPITLYKEVGWIATSNNYVWTAAAGFYVLVCLKRILQDKHLNIVQTISFSIALLYACNQEQMVGILGIVFTYFLITNRNRRHLIVPSIFIAASLVFTLTCPGNAQRNVAEIQNWYPNFNNLTIFDKAYNGINVMMEYALLDTRFIYMLFVGTLMVGILLKRKRTIEQFIGCFPFVCSVFIQFTLKIFVGSERFEAYMPLYESIRFVAYCVIVLCIACCIVILFQENRETQRLALLIYVCGIASRIVIGLSPTVFASGERTSLFLYFSFVMLIYMFVQEIEKLKD